MRQSAVLTLVIAGLFILGTAAVAQANWYHKSEGSDESSSEHMSPVGDQGTNASQPEQYGSPQQMETGGLPPGEQPEFLKDEFLPPGAENAPVVDQGGIKLRIGIDTE